METVAKEFEGKLPQKIINEAIAEAKKRNCSKDQVKKIIQRLKEQYDDAKITAGEGIGIVTAESFGEPSTQMSTSAFEKIIVRIGKKIKVMEIGKFVENIVEPVEFTKVEVSNNSVVITAGRQSKAALIGRNRRRYEELKKIIQNTFGLEFRIV